MTDTNKRARKVRVLVEVPTRDALFCRVYTNGTAPLLHMLPVEVSEEDLAHLGADGEVIEPLTALPPITDLHVSGVYNTDLDGVYPRPGGWVAVGSASSGGASWTLLSALSPQGDLTGHVLLPTDAATATDGERLFALTVGSRAHLYELGCVVP